METKNYIKIYFPSKDKNGNIVNAQLRNAIFDSILTEISVKCGGYTIFSTIGGYYNEDAKLLIKENIDIIQAYGDFDKSRHLELARQIKEIMNQASVMIEHNGEVIFI